MKYRIDEAGNKYRLNRESGEWELIEAAPVGESETQEADNPDHDED